MFAILGLLLLQVSTGLISDDEISAAGPLTTFVSNAAVGWASGYHTTTGKIIIIVLTITHIAAIAFYFYSMC